MTYTTLRDILQYADRSVVEEAGFLPIPIMPSSEEQLVFRS